MQNEGWTITDDPYYLEPEKGIEFYVDLAAEKLIGAKRDNELIAVEIKSFIGHSTIYDFHVAIGQFVNYYLALQDKEPERTLFWAVPELTYYNFFTKNTIQKHCNI